MRKTPTQLLLLLPFTLLLAGCNSDMLSLRMDEGVIEYHLIFPDYDPSGIMAGMLPERTTVTFGNHKQVAEVSAGMGIFRTSIVSDNKKRSMDYYMSMMSKKIVAPMQPRDLDLFSDGRAKPTIIYTGDVDSIAGYPCKRALAIFSGIDQSEIELWYTDEIDMVNANWYTPFGEVPGVLLRYDVVQYGMRMRLEAISVTPGKADPAKFERRQEFEVVAPEVLHHEMAEVMGTFSM